jgi:effector-binding domain-containing protein
MDFAAGHRTSSRIWRRAGDQSGQGDIMRISRLVWLSVLAATVVGFGLFRAPAQTPNPPSSAPVIKVQADDSFGEEVTMAEGTIVYVTGSGLWESAFETIGGAFKTVYAAMDKLGVKASGVPMAIYTATDDTGFQFQAAVPVAQAPAGATGDDLMVGLSPAGKALKFVHRGSYDEMDATYEAITNYLDDKSLEAKELFVERYLKDPMTTPEDDLVIEVYVPLK